MPAGRLSVVLGDYPHTRPLKSGAIAVQGTVCEFPAITPLHGAFARMARDLEFDICEMALATYLQAREAGVPISLLPVVTIGGTHHQSLTRWPGTEPVGPRDLIGTRIGVRAYSQTTGMWVRGILREEYGIEASDVTWVTTEGCHVAQYVEPENVERVDGNIVELLRDGVVQTAVLGPRVVADQGIELAPVIPDASTAAAVWMQRHQTVPVNHMVVVRTELLDSQPEAVRAVYAALRAAVEATAGQRDQSPRGRVVVAHWSDSLRRALDVAGRYCLEQELLRRPVDWDQVVDEVRVLEDGRAVPSRAQSDVPLSAETER